ncbi:MAG: ABC transporter ATP-binding protein/permease [Acidimicrobiia bacterium]|nr:ABC transporter ATP-binding protein/permease [Acidimicrobiia bacterium]
MSELAAVPDYASRAVAPLTIRRWTALWVGALRLLREAAPRPAATVVAAQLVSGVATVAKLGVAGLLLSRLADGGAVFWPLVIAAALLAVGAVAGSVSNEVSMLVSERVAQTAQDRVLAVAAAVDLEAYESPGFQDRLARAQANADEQSWMVVRASIELLTALVGTVAVGAVLVARQPLLAVVVLVGGLPLWVAARRNSSQLYRLQWDHTPLERERGYLQHVLTSRREAAELRVFGLGEYLRDRYEFLYAQRMEAMVSLARHRVMRSAVAAVLSSASGAVALAVLVGLVSRGSLSVADAGVVTLAVWQLQSRVAGAMSGVGLLQEAGRFLDDFVDFTELAPQVAASSAGLTPPHSFERLRVDGVSFRYPGTATTVLRDVSFEVSAGQVVAIVGRNGSGKTTLAKLLCGLYQPSAGRIWWDDVALDRCDRALVARRVGALFQDFATYELSARENVAFGDQTRAGDSDALERAAARAGAREMIGWMPAEWETRLSREYEGGVDLSVGQWQRLALARAFFRDAPFLVLDEPTSALDPRAEAELFAALRDLYAERTVVLISHRFSSVRSADVILVMDRGRLVEAGDHAALMGRRGLYAELYDLQASAYLDRVPEGEPVPHRPSTEPASPGRTEPPSGSERGRDASMTLARGDAAAPAPAPRLRPRSSRPAARPTWPAGGIAAAAGSGAAGAEAYGTTNGRAPAPGPAAGVGGLTDVATDDGGTIGVETPIG